MTTKDMLEILFVAALIVIGGTLMTALVTSDSVLAGSGVGLGCLALFIICVMHYAVEND